MVRFTTPQEHLEEALGIDRQTMHQQHLKKVYLDENGHPNTTFDRLVNQFYDGDREQALAWLLEQGVIPDYSGQVDTVLDS